MKIKNIRFITTGALLIAMDIILTRILYAIPIGFAGSNIARVSLKFIPYSFAGAILGPVGAAITCAAGDILGVFVNNGGWSVNPLFTLSAALSGVLYGIMLRRGFPSVRQMVFAVFVNTVIIDLVVNTFLLSYVYGINYVGVFLTARIVVYLILSVPYCFLSALMWKYISPFIKKSFY